jgi:hypothetical protein
MSEGEKCFSVRRKRRKVTETGVQVIGTQFASENIY